MDPAKQAISAIEAASKVASSPVAKVLIDRMTGFKISTWEANGEVIRKQIIDRYELAKVNGVQGIAEATELRQAANLINVASKSAQYVQSDEVRNISIENDFFWNTVEHAKTISDNDIQELLAKIMAREYDHEGQFSMNTLQVLRNLGKKELEEFMKVASLVINVNMIPVKLFEKLQPFLGNFSFSNFQSLQSIGLILPNEMEKNIILRKKLAFTYHDYLIIFSKEDNEESEVSLPSFYGLSEAGRQIFNVLDVKTNKKYIKWLEENLEVKNYKFESTEKKEGYLNKLYKAKHN